MLSIDSSPQWLGLFAVLNDRKPLIFAAVSVKALYQNLSMNAAPDIVCKMDPSGLPRAKAGAFSVLSMVQVVLLVLVKLNRR